MFEDFSKLKYNLYELLNVDSNSSKKDINKSFRRIIKKFHPDKVNLSKLEKQLYHDITYAYYILNDDDKREKYNIFLNLKRNRVIVNNENNYGSIKHETKKYFPESKQEAFKEYMKQSETLYKRHGPVLNTSGNIKKMVKNKLSERKEIKKIDREDFRDTGEFNDRFIERKQTGNYSDKIIEYNGDKIIPFELNRSKLNITSLKDFHNMYTEDTVREHDMTSLSQAFLLQPHTNVDEDFNLTEKIDEYNNQNIVDNNFDF
jgi:curved DNA-binding protein CbpA